MSRTLIRLIVPLWLTKTTCSSLSPSSGKFANYGKPPDADRERWEENRYERTWQLPDKENPTTNTAAREWSVGSCIFGGTSQVSSWYLSIIIFQLERNIMGGKKLWSPCTLWTPFYWNVTCESYSEGRASRYHFQTQKEAMGVQDLLPWKRLGNSRSGIGEPFWIPLPQTPKK